MMRNRIVCLLLLCVVSVGVCQAQGKSTKRLSDQEKQAFSLYQEGRYREACDIYIATTKAHNSVQNARLVVGLTIFLLVDVIGVLFFLYVEKRKAYRLLVDKNADCAKRPVMSMAAIDFGAVDVSEGRDRQLLEMLHQLLEGEKVYLDSDLTIESLAARMGSNRNVVSKLVNQHLGRSFPALLNQYRVNEAVMLLTDSSAKNYTIEAIAQMCGYNNRQVFHSAFKKETGLTPTEFREVAKSRD